MLTNLLTSPKPITFSEWKYLLTSNHLLLPVFLSLGGIDSIIDDHTNVNLRMVVDVNAKSGRHQYDSVQHLLYDIYTNQGLFRMFKGGTAQQARMIGSLISSLVRYCSRLLLPSPIQSLISPIISSMIKYPFDTISLTHLRSKQVRLFKTPKVINQLLKGNTGSNEIEVIINNAMSKVRKVFEEMETLKNNNGIQGLYRGYFSGFLLESVVSLCSNLVIGNIFDLLWKIWKGNYNNSNYEFTKTIITYSLSHLITAPFTFARMRYQSDFENEYSSFRDCVNRIYKKEGWRAFYRTCFISLYIF